MRMSISTTSGRSAFTTCSASSPSAASPTTSMSGWAARIVWNPARTTAWSSTTTRRITGALRSGSGRGAGSHRAARGRRRPHRRASRTRSRMPVKPTPSRSVSPDPVVVDGDHELVAAEVDRDRCMRRRGVPDRHWSALPGSRGSRRDRRLQGAGRRDPDPWNSTASPARRARVDQLAACRDAGTGADGVPSSRSRSTPSNWRSSASAARPPAASPSNAATRSTSDIDGTLAAASACTTSIVTLWVTTSCSSRAMRWRSSEARRFHRLRLLGSQRGVAGSRVPRARRRRARSSSPITGETTSISTTTPQSSASESSGQRGGDDRHDRRRRQDGERRSPSGTTRTRRLRATKAGIGRIGSAQSTIP